MAVLFQTQVVPNAAAITHGMLTRDRKARIRHERLPEVTLLVRRHGGNMTAGKSKEELNRSALAAFKKALDRSRHAGRGAVRSAAGG